MMAAQVLGLDGGDEGDAEEPGTQAAQPKKLVARKKRPMCDRTQRSSALHSHKGDEQVGGRPSSWTQRHRKAVHFVEAHQIPWGWSRGTVALEPTESSLTSALMVSHFQASDLAHIIKMYDEWAYDMWPAQTCQSR